VLGDGFRRGVHALSVTDQPTLRRYRLADEERVWKLHLAALRDAGVDVDAAPPEADADPRSIPSVYLDGERVPLLLYRKRL